ncbi:hypothetical protein QJS66_10780 [Kocuria rhizophila]|nr:hypothetical protein QJS66_10780 [Kocuria rhizophila]
MVAGLALAVWCRTGEAWAPSIRVSPPIAYCLLVMMYPVLAKALRPPGHS